MAILITKAIELKSGMDLEMRYHKFIREFLAFSEDQTMLGASNDVTGF